MRILEVEICQREFAVMAEVGRFNIWQSGGGGNEMDSSDLKERGFNPKQNLRFKMLYWKSDTKN